MSKPEFRAAPTIYSEVIMKIHCIVLAFVFSVAAGCGNDQQIHARNMKSAHKSFSFIKDRLPANLGIEFTAAYWALRDDIKNDDEFLKAIDGKTPPELIDMGKENFKKHKTAGEEKYRQYENWEQMISLYAEQRKDQDLKGRADPRDKQGYPRVDYKMHAM